MKKLLSILIIMLVTMGMSVELLGKGRSGGFSSSRSSSSSSKSWGSSSTKSSGTKSSGTKSSSSKGWGSSSSSKSNTSKPALQPKKMTAAQKKSLTAAKKSGTAYKTKSQAATAFKSNKEMQSKYKSTYTSKPATRPEHIPASTKVGNNTYNVTYNQQHGGYGYMGPSGSWIMYNAMSDAVMLTALMQRNNYVHTHAVTPTATVVHHSTPMSGLAILFTILAIVFVIGLSAYMIEKA